MSKVLVTGGTGFVGTHLIDRLIKLGNEDISVVARNEGKLLELKAKYPNIELVMGDIHDKFIVEKATKNINILYHLAAFKHASHAELHPHRCIGTNIIGTINLLDSFRGQQFIAMSTDKACGTKGVYGLTKRLMEKLVQEYEPLYQNVKYRTIRCGNIINSTGSVTYLWRDAILNGRELIVTDLNATRYFWTVGQIVDLILEAPNSQNSQPIVPIKMKSIDMGTLLDAIQDKYGKASNIKTIGLQSGENLHEKLTENGISSRDAIKYSFDEIVNMI